MSSHSAQSPIRMQANAWRLWVLRLQLLRRIIRQSLQTARLRTALIGVLTLVFWGGVFILFAEGFRFLATVISHDDLRMQAVHAMFNIFFVSLLVMLIMSSAIVLYGGLYRNQETDFLLTIPVCQRRIVLYRFQETVLISCWGLLLLGSPMLIAYGRVTQSPWHYYLLMFPFLIAFVFIPSGIGAIICLLVVYYLPCRRLHVIVGAVVAVVVCVALVFWVLLFNSGADVMTPSWFQDTLARLQYSEHRLLPSWWLSSGLLESAHPTANGLAWGEAIGFFAVLSSNALLLYLLVGAVGRRLFLPGYSALHGMDRSRRMHGAGWMDWGICHLLFPFSKPMGLLFVRDLRIFRRDPIQWSQFGIFIGLLVIYFLNVRRFNYGQRMPQWTTMVGYLNLTVMGLILSTFTTRFIFPLVSLEGRRFWILGTLPLSRDTVLWSKFLFAVFITVPPCVTLILISDVVLRISEWTPMLAVLHQVICLVLCLGLSAIAVGLGAVFPNLRESSPSKIAAGFGGTLNLVISALFILLSILATAVPSYLWVAARDYTRTASALEVRFGSTAMVAIGMTVTVALGVTAVVIPLFYGLRAFRRLED